MSQNLPISVVHLYTWFVFLLITLLHMATFLVLFRYGSQENMGKKVRYGGRFPGLCVCVKRELGTGC